MKYERLNFLSVTFTLEGLARTVRLTPTAPGAASTSDVNPQVAAWFQLVQAAAIQATGTAPPASDTVSVSVSAQPDWNRTGLPLFFGFVLTAVVASLVLGQGANLLSLSLGVLSVLFMLAAGWYSVGFLQANSALKQARLDAVTSDDPPTPEQVDGAGRRKTEKSPLPGSWTVSAWVFIAIGIVAIVDTLAEIYSRPWNFTFYPGMVHLFAGIALLTLNPRWRRDALAGLWLAFLAEAFIGVTMAISPQKGSVSLPMLDLSVSPIERPYLAAATAVFLTVMVLWPYCLLTCARGKALFAIAPKK